MDQHDKTVRTERVELKGLEVNGVGTKAKHIKSDSSSREVTLIIAGVLTTHTRTHTLHIHEHTHIYTYTTHTHARTGKHMMWATEALIFTQNLGMQKGHTHTVH